MAEAYQTLTKEVMHNAEKRRKHRRAHAAEAAGLESILPSERAFAYKMKPWEKSKRETWRG